MKILSLVFLATFLLVTLEASAQPVPANANSIPSPRVPDGVKAYRDVEYIPKSHERHKLDLFVPENAVEPLPFWAVSRNFPLGCTAMCAPPPSPMGAELSISRAPPAAMR